ncbi:hypothetical protein PPTG_23568 [Phytophthora nicotianae INRA-310]|uniref:Uncharacterized protein n=4 Tax=Phytophthora nicotianae TaxID=4792 RepID=W2PWC8_PHYN3|nr:hypothetical protein PPTG_23568 [Phytophthora nicotianae INRA-310]ETN04559.1 hypothetical protein PPTG_23568 [Phytophthora nicotianae INRA-310]
MSIAKEKSAIVRKIARAQQTQHDKNNRSIFTLSLPAIRPARGRHLRKNQQKFSANEFHPSRTFESIFHSPQ